MRRGGHSYELCYMLLAVDHIYHSKTIYRIQTVNAWVLGILSDIKESDVCTLLSSPIPHRQFSLQMIVGEVHCFLKMSLSWPI